MAEELPDWIRESWHAWCRDEHASRLALEGFSVSCCADSPLLEPVVTRGTVRDWLAPAHGTAARRADLRHWVCRIPGPAKSVWAGCRIPVLLFFSDSASTYSRPKAFFPPGFFHVNVFETSGKLLIPQGRGGLCSALLPLTPFVVKTYLRALSNFLAADFEISSLVGTVNPPAFNLLVSGEGDSSYRLREVAEAQKYRSTSRALLADDLGLLLDSEAGADVVFTLNGGARVKAHKVILSARSPVLRAILLGSGSLAPADPSSVPVQEDIDERTLKLVLTYIYTDDCALSSAEEAQHVYNAAAHYGLPRLAELCIQKLFDEMSVSNAATTLCLADAHCCTELKTAALIFAARNLALVMRTEGWRRLTSLPARENVPTLQDEVMFTLASGAPPGPGDMDVDEAGAADAERRVKQRTASPAYCPPSPAYSPTSPAYSPTSPAYGCVPASRPRPGVRKSDATTQRLHPQPRCARASAALSPSF